MAPNPIMLPRKRPQQHEHQGPQKLAMKRSILALVVAVLLVRKFTWAQWWLFSGAAVESVLVIFGATCGSRIFPSIPLWSLLATFNLGYAIVSTSWLLISIFTVTCWPLILLTCLFQFEFAANYARKALRVILRDLHFTRDRIAFFDLPALEIDTEVDGLFVVRGVTISLSDLTLIAHGVEVGIRLTDDIELALLTDQVRVSLFRRIEVSDVYANLKGGEAEMTFGSYDDDASDDSDNLSIFNESALLRAATAGSEGVKRRPTLRESLAGGSYIQDTSPEYGFDAIKTLSPDNQIAEKQYIDMLTEMRTTSAIYQSRATVRQAMKKEGKNVDNERELRAAICSELHQYPFVPHPPRNSITVTKLQHLLNPRIRRLLHRMPFLLRLLLAPLGYFHPVTFHSINAAGSGLWAKELLQEHLFKSHGDKVAELRRLQRRMSKWLEDANFCVQFTYVDGLGQVPLTNSFDMVAYLHFSDIMAYRALPQSRTFTEVVRLGGADATFTMPIYLLPHHEHLLPPRPTAQDEEEMENDIARADGLPKTVQAKKKLDRVRKDETVVQMSVHASLPATFHQSLLSFAAAMIKATKIIDFDKDSGKNETGDGEGRPLSRASTATSMDSTDSLVHDHRRGSSDVTAERTGGNFKSFAKNLHQNLRASSIDTSSLLSKEGIRDMVKDLHQSTKKSMVGSMVNDRWIAKMVGKIAIKLEKAQGDVGYSGDLPVPLEPYRPKEGDDGEMPKLLP